MAADEDLENEGVEDADSGLKDLRRKAKQADELTKANTDLARKVAFLEAGVDTTTPLGQMFAKGYDGELTGEAIKAAAGAVGAIKAPAPPPPSADDNQPPSIDSARHDLASGSAPPDNTPSTDPWADAAAVRDKAVAQGSTKEQGLTDAIRVIREASDRGDSRVNVRP